MNIFLIILCILIVISQIILYIRNKNICNSFDDLFIKFVKHNQEIYNIQKKSIDNIKTSSMNINNQIKEFQGLKHTYNDLKDLYKNLDTQINNLKRTVEDFRNQKVVTLETNKLIKSIHDEINILKKQMSNLK